MRFRFISSDSWLARSCRVCIPAGLLGSLLRHCSCAQLSKVYGQLGWLFSLLPYRLCPHHPLLSPRGKEEQADELGKSQPRLGSLNTVSIYALELTLYTFLP